MRAAAPVLLALLLGALSIPEAPPARADAKDELRSLREQAAQLRKSLDELDARIRALEAAPGTAAPRSEASPPPPSAAALKRSWNAIELGASQNRVGAILGKPERVLSIDGSVVWYYVYDVGRGSVFFDGSGKVSGLQPPVSGWSW
jgi:hypothetical protein